MKRVAKLSVWFISGMLLILQACQKPVTNENSRNVLDRFQNPPAAYRPMPLWVWNDRVSRQQIEEQLADFHDKGFGGVFVHPRPGLITPYLSKEWLDMFQYTVEKAKQLSMQVWIYDENSYPSGFAGGHVQAQMPDASGLGLVYCKKDTLKRITVNPPLCILKKEGEQFQDVTELAREKDLGTGTFYLFSVRPGDTSGWYGGFSYVDLMRRDVTEKFLQITMEAYRARFGDEFGGVIPGTFQDEAEIYPVDGRDVVNYTPALFSAFHERWGYDLKSRLVSLFEPVGDYRQVRHHYYQTLMALFIANWANPYYEYCEANRLILTGHYWEHHWPWPNICPDNMALTAYAQMPGIDILMNQWRLDTHAQFGNARSVRELSSIANQLGRKRTLSETYGASGWDLSFMDQKRIGDWEYALGVNFMNPHLSYITIMGSRKRDHPLSFSYHEPWWKHYRAMTDYFGRLSVALTAGEQMNPLLVLEPNTTMWMYYTPLEKFTRADTLAERFQNFVHQLETQQLEYDLGCEDVLRNHGRVKGSRLQVGRRSYGLVVLPPAMENLDQSTLKLLEEYLRSGGQVVSSDQLPRFVDGTANEACSELMARFSKQWRAMKTEQIAIKLSTESGVAVSIKQITPPQALLFHHVRDLADSRLFFITNVSDSQAVSAEIHLPAGSVEKWDLNTGAVTPFPFIAEGDKVHIPIHLYPAGSLLLCVREQKALSGPAVQTRTVPMPLSGDLQITRRLPNILTLDYCDLWLGGKTEKDLYFYDAQRKIFKHHGLETNPWDSAVQFKDNIISKDTFQPESGFSATYHFQIRSGLDPSAITAVVERAQLYRMTCNGQPVTATKDQWWLDKCFNVFEIGKYLHPGDNEITLTARPFTIYTELEPVYLLGSFSLQPQSKGFILVPPQAMSLGPWNHQGMPFYPAEVAYEQSVNISEQDLREKKIIVALGKWQGTLAHISINDRPAGLVFTPPYQLNITNYLNKGQNRIVVEVMGSLKNLLGPHHNNPPAGSAWPAMFQKGAKDGHPGGKVYHTLEYGLYEPFQVLAQ